MEIRTEINREELKRARCEVKRARQEMHRIQRKLRQQARAQRENVQRGMGRGAGWGMGQGQGRGRGFAHGAGPGFKFREPRAAGATHGTRFSMSFGSFGRGWGGRREGAQAAAPKRNTSDEERLTILKMLEGKKITPEQAETLLNALGDA